MIRRVAIDLPAIFDEMWFLTTSPMINNYTHDLRRVVRVKELPVYLREALPSRMNPIALKYTVASFSCLHFAVGCSNRRRKF